jgi:hypothetical protein
VVKDEVGSEADVPKETLGSPFVVPSSSVREKQHSLSLTFRANKLECFILGSFFQSILTLAGIQCLTCKY